jgi:hypothetical protein
LSYQALGLDEEAHGWLKKALAFAENHGLGQLIFDAEAALQATEDSRKAVLGGLHEADEPADEILAVRQGLREMREALAVSSEDDHYPFLLPDPMV